MIKWLERIYKNQKGVILYLFFGGLTTFLNIGLYIICSRIGDFGTTVSNIVAWIGGVLFAYITNRSYVFHSESKGIKEILRELIGFVSCRLATGIVDLTIMYIFVNLFHYNDLIIKVIANIIVIILNYIGSKLLVFKSTKNLTQDRFN